MDTSVDLFRTLGYDVVTIEHITKAVGVAKGTFYYHFDSKQDLLAQVVQRFVDELLADLDSYVATLDTDAVTGFQLAIAHASGFKLARFDSTVEIMSLLYKPENRELRHQLYDAWLEQCRGTFLPLIQRGHDDGTFTVSDPAYDTLMVMSLWVDAMARVVDVALGATDAADFAEQVTRAQRALFRATEGILGAAPGSFAQPDHTDALVALYQPFRDAVFPPRPESQVQR